jgi:hypothetical protein
MEPMGWEIQPAGWILLFILIIFLAGQIIKWVQYHSAENQQKSTFSVNLLGISLSLPLFRQIPAVV